MKLIKYNFEKMKPLSPRGLQGTKVSQECKRVDIPSESETSNFQSPDDNNQ